MATNYSLWINGRTGGGVAGNYADFTYWGPSPTEAGVNKSNGTRQGIRDALETLKDLPGVNGPVTYTAGDHTGQNFRSIAIGRLENGKPVLPK